MQTRADTHRRIRNVRVAMADCLWSLDSATAEAEIRYWLPHYSGRPRRARTLYYQGFSCIFDGTEKDLRPKIVDWPDLVHNNDHSFCNRLGAEAKRLEIDGLVT